MESCPSISRQKSFSVENSDILNYKTKTIILSLVMMEIGKNTTINNKSYPVILENQKGEVSINLDNINNNDIILHIYNIIRNHRLSLTEPAH